MKMRDYQQRAHATDELKKTTLSIYGLVGEIGGIFSLFKKRARDRQPFDAFRPELVEELGDILWYVSSIASLHDISLEEVAKNNLDKARSLFDEGAVREFDKSFPAHQRLPRTMRVTFALDPKTGRAQMFLGDQPLGNALSDNASEADGYRFHDAFHLAFAAHLGWSPVLRRLLRRKRKSDPQIDENEDGARAAVTEEAVSAIVFSYAEDHGMFPDIRAIPFSLLKTVRNMVKKFEVRACTSRQWQHAIWSGCRAYEELVKNNGGVVELDLDERRIEYVAVPVKRPARNDLHRSRGHRAQRMAGRGTAPARKKARPLNRKSSYRNRTTN